MADKARSLASSFRSEHIISTPERRKARRHFLLFLAEHRVFDTGRNLRAFSGDARSGHNPLELLRGQELEQLSGVFNAYLVECFVERDQARCSLARALIEGRERGKEWNVQGHILFGPAALLEEAIGEMLVGTIGPKNVNLELEPTAVVENARQRV